MEKGVCIDCSDDLDQKDEDLEYLDEKMLTLDLVSGFAGDRSLTQMEYQILEKLKQSRGELFHLDLL